MAITLGNGRAKSSKAAKGRYSALAIAACIAAAAIAVGFLTLDFGGKSAPATPPKIGEFRPVPDQLSYTFYIVESQEQADYVYWAENEAANDRASSNAPEPNAAMKVFTVTTPEEAEAVRVQIAETVMVEEGAWPIDYRVVDMRAK